MILEQIFRIFIHLKKMKLECRIKKEVVSRLPLLMYIIRMILLNTYLLNQ